MSIFTQIILGHFFHNWISLQSLRYTVLRIQWRLIFAYVIRRFIYFKFTSVLFYLMFFTSVKGIDRSEVWEQNCVWLFYYFNFERNYDVLMSKSSCIFLNKNITFNKNETESKMQNSTHGFRETSFTSCKNRKLKVKLWSVGACKRKKRAFFCTAYFVRRKILMYV